MTLTIPIITSLITVAALWWLLRRDKLDWLRGLLIRQIIPALVAIGIAVVIIFLARESRSYPPAPDYTGQDESAPIGGGYGNASRP